HRRRTSHRASIGGRDEPGDRSRTRAARGGLRGVALHHRANQAASADLETRGIHRRDPRMGRSDGPRHGWARVMIALADQFGRRIEYLRISVTDRCNFRCVYCMPAEGLPWLPKQDILTYEEIAAIVAQLAPLGLRRLRITGGEPTIRPNLAALVRMLRAVPGIEDIALSTNGVRLAEMAADLVDAGLDRVN